MWWILSEMRTGTRLTLCDTPHSTILIDSPAVRDCHLEITSHRLEEIVIYIFTCRIYI